MPSGKSLICLRDASLAPRRLERLDPATGARQLLFDPNPDFRNLTLGQVRRLRWAQFIRPAGDRRPRAAGRIRPGKRYPLVVVQYQTRGFLRGGTGDEYPIQAFANRGYAVLSVQRPLPVALLLGARSSMPATSSNLKGLADHKHILVAGNGHSPRDRPRHRRPETPGYHRATATARPTMVWALLHSRLFAAAAMSSCFSTRRSQCGQAGRRKGVLGRNGYLPEVRAQRPFLALASLFGRSTQGPHPDPAPARRL